MFKFHYSNSCGFVVDSCSVCCTTLSAKQIEISSEIRALRRVQTWYAVAAAGFCSWWRSSNAYALRYFLLCSQSAYTEIFVRRSLFPVSPAGGEVYRSICIWDTVATTTVGDKCKYTMAWYIYILRVLQKINPKINLVQIILAKKTNRELLKKLQYENA